jgi:hypothetical protein
LTEHARASGILKRLPARRAALLGGQPVDPRSYVTEQTWLESLLETGLAGATKRKAA